MRSWGYEPTPMPARPQLSPYCAARRTRDTSTGARRFSTSRLTVPLTPIFIGNSPTVFGAPSLPMSRSSGTSLSEEHSFRFLPGTRL